TAPSAASRIGRRTVSPDPACGTPNWAQQAQAQSSAATPGDAPAPATAKPNQVAFSVTTASWVEVRDANGTIVLSSTLQPGAQTSVEAAPPARVVIGNATGVQLQWQGAAVDLAPFRRGNVARLTLE
ncbi:DUF4115 domain-containing protein, partial [Achromobacter sp. GG226]|uniref:DUF4115 domain-containing protein n=1 Tax=Verticiella alkaliphila TaxID=2779529 RepID=UPI001C0AD6C1